MSDQTLQILLAIGTILVAIIGFLIGRSVFSRLDSHSDRLNAHDGRMDDQDTTIAKITSDLRVNDERDKLIRESVERSMSDMKEAMKEMTLEFRSNTKVVNELIISLKPNQKK